MFGVTFWGHRGTLNPGYHFGRYLKGVAINPSSFGRVWSRSVKITASGKKDATVAGVPSRYDSVHDSVTQAHGTSFNIPAPYDTTATKLTIHRPHYLVFWILGFRGPGL